MISVLFGHYHEPALRRAAILKSAPPRSPSRRDGAVSFQFRSSSFRQHRLLERVAARTGFLEARGNDDRIADARFRAVADQPGHRRGRRDDHREVRGLGQSGKGSIGRSAEHNGPLGIHRKDPAFESRKIFQHRAADTAGGFGGTDDRDRARGEEGGEGIQGVVHGPWISG